MSDTKDLLVPKEDLATTDKGEKDKKPSPKPAKKPVKKGEVDSEELYDNFITENRKPWIWFNLLSSLGSIILAVGTFLIIHYQERNCIYANLYLPLYIVLILHSVNAFETLLNLTGFERKIC
jgi:hypothetical protein